MDGMLGVLWLLGQLLTVPYIGLGFAAGLMCVLLSIIWERRDMEQYLSTPRKPNKWAAQ